MKIEVDNVKYDVIIIYKNNKNMYLKIKDDLSIVVTAPFSISERRIKKFILENYDYIAKHIRKKVSIRERKLDKFLYLGNFYDICYVNKKSVEIGYARAFIGRNANIDNWYRNQAKEVFAEVYSNCFDNFSIKVQKPVLKIRKMKGKWGVCNITNNIITLNVELIKYDIKYLEYVIYHELCHLKYANHSKDFWNLVEIYVPDYKILRKEMKNI